MTEFDFRESFQSQQEIVFILIFQIQSNLS
jgi:hypothetical protein